MSIDICTSARSENLVCKHACGPSINETYFNTFQNGSLVRRWLFYTFIEFLNVRKEVKLRKEILPQKNLRVNVSKNQRK